MKKVLFTLVLLSSLFITHQADAQETMAAYQKGDKLFYAGISFGTYGYGYLGARSGGFIPVNAALEFGVHDNISVGPYLGYASWRYNYGGGARYSWNFYSVGLRGSFHYLPYLNEFLDLNIDPGKFDFYATLLAGVEVRRFSSTDTFLEGYYDNQTGIAFGPFLGFKYMFNDKIGAYLEGGRGAFGYGTLGIAAKF
jgi:outer membrane immunogenic protein